jgi:hypothetical protein
VHLFSAALGTDGEQIDRERKTNERREGEREGEPKRDMKSQREQMREERAKICASQEGLHPASSMNIKQSTLACSTPCQHNT